MATHWQAWIDALEDRQGLFIAADGSPRFDHAWPVDKPLALLPGSFNPVHVGHWGLAEAAAHWTGRDVVFEISLTNVDKPSLDAEEVARRLIAFRDRAGVWLTKAPRFVHKAQLFPGSTLIVGADTAARIVDPAYYGEDEDALAQALTSIRKQGCRFLVAGRANDAGQYQHLDDLAIPSSWQDLFNALPADRFRLDISSRQMRRQPCGSVVAGPFNEK